MSKRRTRQVQNAQWDSEQFAAHASNQTDEILFEMEAIDSQEESDAIMWSLASESTNGSPCTQRNRSHVYHF